MSKSINTENNNKNHFDQNISSNNNLTPRMIHINKILNKTTSTQMIVSKKTSVPALTNVVNSTQNKESNSVVKNNRHFISSLANAIAKDNNIDISKIKGTGVNNRIMKKDVLNWINTSSQNNKVVPTEVQVSNKQTSVIGEELQEKRVKVTTLRKTIAKVMKNSWDTVAYTNLFTEIDMTKLWEFRAKIKDKVLKATGIKITFLAFIVKALALAIKKYPNMNATYDEKTSELVLKPYFNAGIAVDTKSGLMVPVIKHADQISVLGIAKEIIRLGELARTGKISMNDMSDGTFSITNYGSFGALAGVPVINYPQLALAGIGGIIDKVAIINGQVSPRKVMLLTIAADHRWIDGGDIAKYARDVKALLEEPAMIWMESEMKNV